MGKYPLMRPQLVITTKKIDKKTCGILSYRDFRYKFSLHINSTTFHFHQQKHIFKKKMQDDDYQYVKRKTDP